MKKTLLFTIIMALLCLASPMSAQTSVGTTNGELNFQRPANAWLWTGRGSDNRWDNSDNWAKPNNASDHFPGETKGNALVYIPTTPAGGKFPAIDAKITISKIYLAKGAMLEGQYNLVATDGWYTDIVIPANRYVMLSSPLKQTYMGDFFTATQGGTYVGPFSPAVYDAIDADSENGTTGNNRKFPYSIYQRLFASAVDVLYDIYTLHYYDAAWSTPTNVMNYEYQVGEGFQVLARANLSSEMADFHFPSDATEYYYYKNDGTRSDVSEQTSRSNAGKPAYDAANLTVTLRRNKTSDTVLWAAGNPAFATMDILEFLKENLRAGYTGCYLYKHSNGNGTPSNISGSEILYYMDPSTYQLIEGHSIESTTGTNTPNTSTSTTNDPYINRNNGFLVPQGNGEIQTDYASVILGTYSMNLTPATISWNIPRAIVSDVSGSNNALQGTNTDITIVRHPDQTNKVLIYNLAGISNNYVEATVTDTREGAKITINPGAIVGTYSGWTGNDAENTNMVVYGYNGLGQNQSIVLSTGDSRITSNARSPLGWFAYWVNSLYATNVSESSSLTFTISYDKDANGNITKVHISADNCFALYPETSATKFFYVGSIGIAGSSIGNFFSSTWNAFNTYSGEKTVTQSTTGTTTGNGTDELKLIFTPNMFTTSTTAAQSAPRKTAAHGGNTISIVANYNNRTVNTFFVRNNEATNGFSSAEDAPIIGEFDEDVFSIGTLAGATRVAVNAINDTTRAQIVLTGVNGEVELVFDNLEALGENVRLFDANDSTERPLNGNHDNVTVNFGVNDSPLRYSLIWDYAPIISGNETLVDLDFTVFSPAKGEVKVMSGDIMNNVRLYNAAGQLVKSIAANSNDASFSALLPGIYVVEIYTNNGRGTKKVDVK